MLAVSDRSEAQKIWYAVQNSSGWTLALRPVSKAVDSPEDVEGLPSLLKDGVSTSKFQHFTTGGAK
jgi:hypothetical protein